MCIIQEHLPVPYKQNVDLHLTNSNICSVSSFLFDATKPITFGVGTIKNMNHFNLNENHSDAKCSHLSQIKSNCRLPVRVAS